jgi:hypothetical protein
LLARSQRFVADEEFTKTRYQRIQNDFRDHVDKKFVDAQFWFFMGVISNTTIQYGSLKDVELVAEEDSEEAKSGMAAQE